MRLRAARGPEKGSAAIEAVIVVPALGFVVLLVVFGGRVAVAQQAVQTAAFEAARAASLARAPGPAKDDAAAAAQRSLGNQGLKCAPGDVAVDTSGLTAPVGTASTVSATVTCHVDLSDLAVPLLPGTRVVSATMTSPVDQHRERP